MTSRSDQPAVRLRGVSKRYGSTTAVSDLDLDVHRAEVLALLGPNGAGKTTTVEMCEGFIRPDAGTIEILGLDPSADNARVRERIGVMLQGGGGYPAARAGEMLNLVASYAANPLDPQWLMDTLGLTEAAAPPTGGCPAASSSDWRWRARWSAAPNWCSSTSRPRAWTRTRESWCGS